MYFHIHTYTLVHINYLSIYLPIESYSFKTPFGNKSNYPKKMYYYIYVHIYTCFIYEFTYIHVYILYMLSLSLFLYIYRLGGNFVCEEVKRENELFIGKKETNLNNSKRIELKIWLLLLTGVFFSPFFPSIFYSFLKALIFAKFLERVVNIFSLFFSLVFSLNLQ
jgi:hypothetical protein